MQVFTNIKPHNTMFVFIPLARQLKWLPRAKCGVSGWRFAQPAQISSDVYLHACCCEIVMLWTEVLEKLWDINLPNVIVLSSPWPCDLPKTGRPRYWDKTWCRLEVLHKGHNKDELTFPMTVSQMFACCSLSQRAMFGNPWTSTTGLQHDGVMVAMFFLRNGSVV